MWRRRLSAVLVAVLPGAVLPAAASGAPATGGDSRAAAPAAAMASSGSMARQNSVAREEGYLFMRTPADVQELVARGHLVHADGTGDYQLANVSFPVARPEVIVFLERLSADYREACGERLVVTSLTRPVTRQPANSSRLSVHPAGMAIDLRIPTRPECRRWLESRLLELQAADVLEVIRERRPPHYHVGLFPAAYRQMVEAEVEAERARMAAEDEAYFRASMTTAHVGGGAGKAWVPWITLLALTPVLGLLARSLRLRRRPSA